MAVAAIGLRTPSPEKPPFDPFKLLEGLLWRRVHQQLMKGHRSQNGLEEGEAPDFVHQLGLPSG